MRTSHLNNNGDHSPELPEGFEKFRNPDNFIVPEGYFESFQQRLTNKIREQKTGIRPIRSKRIMIPAAALFVLLLGISAVLVFTRNQEISPAVNYPHVTVDDLDAAFMTDNLNESMVVDHLLTTTGDEQQGEAVEFTIDDSGYPSSEEIIEYLMQSNDIESLLITL